MGLFSSFMPKDIENIITYNLLVLFVIAFYHMTYYDNVGRINCVNFFIGVQPELDFSVPVNNLYNISFSRSVDVQTGYFLDYKNVLLIKNEYIKLADFYLYFLVIPLMNIFYGFWCLKNGLLRLPKHLYTRLYTNIPYKWGCKK